MKRTIKLIILVIVSILAIVLNYNNVYASFADFDDEQAEKQTENLIKEQKEEQEKVQDKSNNNFLESLQIEGFELEPEFNKEILEYTIKGNSEPTKFNVNTVASDSKASVSKNGEIEFENPVRIDVTAENGTVRTYLVKFETGENNEENETEKEENNEEQENTEQENEVKTNENNNETNQNKKETKEDKKDNPIISYVLCGVAGLVVIIAIIRKIKYERK